MRSATEQPAWDPALEVDLEGASYGESAICPYFAYGSNLALPLLALGVLAGRALLLRRRIGLERRTEAQAKGGEPARGPAIVYGTVDDIERGGA